MIAGELKLHIQMTVSKLVPVRSPSNYFQRLEKVGSARPKARHRYENLIREGKHMLEPPTWGPPTTTGSSDIQPASLSATLGASL